MSSVKGDTLVLEFRGKSGVVQRALGDGPRGDAHRARAVAIFPGRSSSSGSTKTASADPSALADVNDYLREASGGPFTAKDFRTWFATLEALELLRTQRADTAERSAQAGARMR